MSTYAYEYKQDNKRVQMTLLDSRNQVKWVAAYPSYVELPSGDMEPDYNPVELGVMKSFSDKDGLKDHLCKLGIINVQDKIV